MLKGSALLTELFNSSRQAGKTGARRYAGCICIAFLVAIIAVAINPMGLFSDSDRNCSSVNRPSQLALQYYIEKHGEPVEAEEHRASVRRLGCHEEIHVFKNGKVVTKMHYANGKVFETD